MANHPSLVGKSSTFIYKCAFAGGVYEKNNYGWWGPGTGGWPNRVDEGPNSEGDFLSMSLNKNAFTTAHNQVVAVALHLTAVQPFFPERSVETCSPFVKEF